MISLNAVLSEAGGGHMGIGPATPDMELDETKKSPMVEDLWAKQWGRDYGALVRFLGVRSCAAF